MPRKAPLRPQPLPRVGTKGRADDGSAGLVDFQFEAWLVSARPAPMDPLRLRPIKGRGKTSNTSMKIVLSFGMGVESSALLMRWLEEPESRDFNLENDLIVITSQTGGEYPDTKKLCEEHLLPRMRSHRVRYV